LCGYGEGRAKEEEEMEDGQQYGVRLWQEGMMLCKNQRELGGGKGE